MNLKLFFFFANNSRTDRNFDLTIFHIISFSFYFIFLFPHKMKTVFEKKKKNQHYKPILEPLYFFYFFIFFVKAINFDI